MPTKPNGSEDFPLIEAAKIVEADMAAAGWHPLDPSDECFKECAFPEMPAHLSALDVAGIQWHLLRLSLYRRFLRERPWSGPGARRTVRCGQALDRAAFLLMMKHVKVSGSMTRELAERAWATLISWEREVLPPAQAKLHALESFPDDPRPCEPAFTLARLTTESGVSDVEMDKMAMARALDMWSRNVNGKKSSKKREVRDGAPAITPFTTDDLCQTFSFVSGEGDVVHRIGPDGQLQLRELEIKTVLDRHAGRESKREREMSVEDIFATTGAVEAADAAERLSDIERAEIVAQVDDIVSTMLESEPSPARRGVLESAVPLYLEELTPTELAGRLGLPDRTVRHAWGKVRDEIRRRLQDRLGESGAA